jgi:hypothetical protein
VKDEECFDIIFQRAPAPNIVEPLLQMALARGETFSGLLPKAVSRLKTLAGALINLRHASRQQENRGLVTK